MSSFSNPLSFSSNNNMDFDPPLQTVYSSLFGRARDKGEAEGAWCVADDVDVKKLPMIDLGRLLLGDAEREGCKKDIAAAAREWGLFQVRNHGVSKQLLERIYAEQMKVFRQPFNKKKEERLLNYSADSYRWGAPNATTLQQVSWSEAYHISLSATSTTATSTTADNSLEEENNSDNLRKAIDELSTAFFVLAHRLVEILAENLGHKPDYFKENCLPSTCYLRLNRYPPCPISQEVFGLIPHTDSDFLTILYQDQVGGLQLLKDGRWITVKPNHETLVVNIGDLFQAWSNGLYKSVEHRVIAQSEAERFSVAYFTCPSYDTVIESYNQPSMYKQFSFKEFRQQVQEDVKAMGFKIGLPRFLK